MRFAVLGSGSKGNSVYIEEGATAILIDNGFTGKEIISRLAKIGRTLSDISAIFLTHEHNDHIAGAGVLSRRCSLPVYANEGTFMHGDAKLGKIYARKEFATGDILTLGSLQIHSFPTSHDTADPVGYVVGNGKVRLGYCTDTGKITQLMRVRMAGCDAQILEFNHDPEMLSNGPYPLDLQQRIRSQHGHLANATAAEFLGDVANSHLRYAVLAHLSEVNNSPDLAYVEAHSILGGYEQIQLVVAYQHSPTELFSL